MKTKYQKSKEHKELHRGLVSMATHRSHWNAGHSMIWECPQCGKVNKVVCICSYHNSSAKEYINNSFGEEMAEKRDFMLHIQEALRGEYGEEIKEIVKVNFKKEFTNLIKHMI